MPMKPLHKNEPELLGKIDQAVQAIRSRTSLVPAVGIILGTGLGDIGGRVDAETVLGYGEVPNFPAVTVQSHEGKMILGRLAGKSVAVLQGRFHYYEGYGLEEVTFAVRVLKGLGAGMMVVTNAAGGLNPAYRKGDIVLIEDHINFMGINPLIGPNDERCGPRFPDMSQPYSARLAGLAKEAARETGLSLPQGIYLGVTGPCLETRAEYRMMRGFGADLVGMSTVPEVIVGVHAGLEILGLSVVTDVCDPDHLEPVDIQDVIRTARSAGPKLDRLIEAIIKKI